LLHLKGILLISYDTAGSFNPFIDLFNWIKFRYEFG